MATDERLPYGWQGSLANFLATEARPWGLALIDHHRALTGEEPTTAHRRAWFDCYQVLQRSLAAVCAQHRPAAGWTLIF
jgi:hypothetical protein